MGVPLAFSFTWPNQTIQLLFPPPEGAFEQQQDRSLGSPRLRRRGHVERRHPRGALADLGSGVSLATSSGRIVVELPTDVDADVRVENGAIRNQLAVDSAGGDSREGRLRGRLGKGGVPIKLRTSNGTISLR